MALEINTTDDGRIQFHGLFEDLQMGPLLLWILEEEQQGELTITINGVQQVIYFADGYPVGTRGGAAENFLGWMLREKGSISDSTYLTSLQKMAEEQQLQGQILLQMGEINEQQLQNILLAQLQRKLIRLFRAFEGEFYFISMEELPVFDIAIGALDPYSLTANAVRQEFSHTRLEHSLSALEGYAIRLDPESQWTKKITSLGLEGDELEALSLLEGWNTPEHFIQQGYLDPTPSKMLIAILFSTNLLELDDAEEHANLTHTIEAPSKSQVRRVISSAAAYSRSAQDVDVSINVETAKRPEGKKKKSNEPRTRASVTVHMKEDHIETKSEIPTISNIHQSRAEKSNQEAQFIPREMPEEFLLPQDDEVKTDPSLIAASPEILSNPSSNQAIPMEPPAPAPAPAVMVTPPRSSEPSPATSPSPSVVNPEEEERKTTIEAKQASLQSANFYQILEISESADAGAIRKAYYAQSRTFHPDSVAGTPLEPLKDALDNIFSHLNEAYSTLSNPTEREEYDKKLQDPEAAMLEERAPKAAQAEVFFSKANVLIKVRDFAAAEEQLQWACKLLDDVGDYQVTLAWAIYNNPKRGAEEKFEKAIFHLENAEQSPHTDQEKMRWYWGSILKQNNDLKGALAQFKLLLKENAKHVEATREVRNLNALLRKEKEQKGNTTKGEKKGLFGFLKK